MQRTLKLTITYDGTNFCGWQRQLNGRSVQEEIERALEKLTGMTVKVCGAGRTDAGVHARGQIAVIRLGTNIPIEKFSNALNSHLPEDIAISETTGVSENFNPRYDAKLKLYRYTIISSPTRSALDRRSTWLVKNPLDLGLMRAAARQLVGVFDFTSFANGERAGENNVREITRCEITDWQNANNPIPRKIEVDIEGRSFLYNMVRNIVGTLVAVGEKKIAPEKIAKILAAKNRQAAGPSAPARGLCLEWIKYGE